MTSALERVTTVSEIISTQKEKVTTATNQKSGIVTGTH